MFLLYLFLFVVYCMFLFVVYFCLFQVAAHSLDTGIRGAYYNVCINLKQVKDEEYASSTSAEVEGILEDSAANFDRVLAIAKNRQS